MNIKEITPSIFVDMVIAGGKQLDDNVELINELNVYPIPDGDTGINMSSTFKSGVEAVKEASVDHVGELSAALAKGLLMGARGNSGVILSQVFRGFTKSVEDKKTLTAKDFAQGLTGAVESAYRAVMKPVEGTILTVVRESAQAGEEISKSTDNVIDVMEAVVEAARITLDKTPEMLEVLKQVGVVDSGGKGLLCIYEGFLSALTGEVIISQDERTPQEDSEFLASTEDELEGIMDPDEVEFGYCTEIMVKLGQRATSDKEFNQDSFKDELSKLGDSLLVVADDEIVKVHVHTEDPGRVLQLGQEYGELIKIKSDNMREQVRQRTGGEGASSGQTEKSPYAIITVAAGKGMADLFRQNGANYVIEGGQTMNPSTQDFVEAIDKLNAEKIIILPNNKNIQMAAEQAANVSDLEIAVIPTRSVPQGLVALLGFNPTVDLADNEKVMNEMITMVKTGQITYAIRDSEIDGVSVKKDEFMGLEDGTIVTSNPDISDTFRQLVSEMVDEFSEIVTIFVGEDGDMDLAKQIASHIEEKSDYIECSLIQGDQPVYPYIVSVE